MKRIVTGGAAEAYIYDADVPQKTPTYTPVSHKDVINKIRSEFGKAGFTIDEETYLTTDKGDVAVGNYAFAFKTDPDLKLAATFVNSYNKQYRFRFALGGHEVRSGATFKIDAGALGLYKRIHNGTADILVDSSIAEIVSQAGDFWDIMIAQKEAMKEIPLADALIERILGAMVLKETITGVQLKTLLKQMRKPSFNYGVPQTSAWHNYNCIALALKESHPATWITDHFQLQDIFRTVIMDDYPQYASVFYPSSVSALALDPADLKDAPVLEEYAFAGDTTESDLKKAAKRFQKELDATAA